MNPLDTFIEKGNEAAQDIMSDEFTWKGTTYPCTLSDLTEDQFLQEPGATRRRNAERMLEIRKSLFTGGLSQIRDVVTAEGIQYEITDIDSLDTTNIFYRIRTKIDNLLET